MAFIMCPVDLMQPFNVSGCQNKVSATNGYVTTTVQWSTYLATLTSLHKIGIPVSSNFQIRLTF